MFGLRLEIDLNNNEKVPLPDLVTSWTDSKSNILSDSKDCLK